jgi:hypothetical protein
MDQFDVTLRVSKPTSLVRVTVRQEAQSPCVAEVLARAKARKAIPGLELVETESIILL